MSGCHPSASMTSSQCLTLGSSFFVILLKMLYSRLFTINFSGSQCQALG
ncbi:MULTISPECIES: hypothetical protein [unclassified Wolbachia]|nr:hypothetical protein [Wolbachia endosymbiont of Nomada panzeri]